MFQRIDSMRGFCKKHYRSLGTGGYLGNKKFSFLCANIPPINVFVRKEYLTQFKEGFGELEEGMWVTVKSKRGKALLFETLLLEFGALYDKLPISAFVWKKDADPKELLPLSYLQIWDCLSYDIAVINKSLLDGLKCSVFMKNGKFYPGTYMFSIDPCHSDSNTLNVGLSEVPPEHKSYNIIKLDNGQFCAQPNNRIIWEEASLIPLNKKKPYFKVCSEDYMCEKTPKWSVADTDDFIYKTQQEMVLVKEEKTKIDKL